MSSDAPLQEGDLMLCIALGRRAERYFGKQAEWDTPLGKIPTPGEAFTQAKEWGQGQLNGMVDEAAQHASPFKSVGEFFERNPGAYAPLIGGGLGLGLGTLTSLSSKNRRKNLLSNALTGGLLGAGAGGLLWGGSSALGLGDNKPATPPASPKVPPPQGVGNRPFDNPAAPNPANQGRSFMGLPVPGTAPGSRISLEEAFTNAPETIKWRNESQIPAANAAGGLMASSASLNRAEDWNRLNAARELARRPVINPDTGAVDESVPEAVKGLGVLNNEIGEKLTNPVHRVENPNAAGAAVGFPGVAGMGIERGPLGLVRNPNAMGAGLGFPAVVGSAEAAVPAAEKNLAVSDNAAHAGSRVAPVGNPHWSRTPGAQDVALGAVGSAGARGLASKIPGIKSPAGTPVPPPAPAGFVRGTLRGLNNTFNPLSGVAGEGSLASKLMSPLKPKNLVAGAALAAGRHAHQLPSPTPLVSMSELIEKLKRKSTEPDHANHPNQ